MHGGRLIGWWQFLCGLLNKFCSESTLTTETYFVSCFLRKIIWDLLLKFLKNYKMFRNLLGRNSILQIEFSSKHHNMILIKASFTCKCVSALSSLDLLSTLTLDFLRHIRILIFYFISKSLEIYLFMQDENWNLWFKELEA